MNKLIHWLIVALILLGISAHSSAKTIKKIDSYGVYVVAKNGYVKVTPYKHYDNFANFKFLNEIPLVVRKSKKVKIIVYTNDFNTGNYRIELRPVQTTIKVSEVNFSVKPMSKKDMYEFTLDDSVADGNMLHIIAPEVSGNNLGIMMLGDTQTELIKYFSNKKLDAAYAVKAYLEDSLVSYPKNKKLKELLGYWTTAALNEKDKRTYKYVDEKWRKYNDATKIHLKVSYLRGMIGEINGYLRDFPKGYKAKEAHERKIFAQKKIREYEPLL
ncbi:hypothetical protein MNBD_GAMMA21-1842 [hydrothermal vent metagenome]|uniref:Uncharacterized protein n=1 Tax=hydrothermal vent metagenome TaxID=652676 RepID=A0A3B1ANZ7_9ZZZZ